jgi:hypothetical protein
MKSEGSLPNTQQPPTEIYSEADDPSPQSLSKLIFIYYFIIFTSIMKESLSDLP